MEGAAVGGRTRNRTKGQSIELRRGDREQQLLGKRSRRGEGEGVGRTRTLAYSRGRGRGPNASIARIWAHSTASKRHANAVSLIVVARRASLPSGSKGRREWADRCQLRAGKKRLEPPPGPSSQEPVLAECGEADVSKPRSFGKFGLRHRAFSLKMGAHAEISERRRPS